MVETHQQQLVLTSSVEATHVLMGREEKRKKTREMTRWTVERRKNTREMTRLGLLREERIDEK
jgi:hypothetical protein